MLNRLFTSLAIVSLLAAVTVAVLWWRGNHGHNDVFHLGADSPTRMWFESMPGGQLAIHQGEHSATGIQGRTDFRPMKAVFGWCLVVPALWGARQARRRLLPRPPGSDLPAMRGLR